VRRYKKVVTVRNPYNRLVSLYLHYASRSAGKGVESVSFAKFAELVAYDDPNLESWFKWSISDWLNGVEVDELLHTETLKEDLHKIGLEVKNLPFLNKNYRAQMYKDFYTPEIMNILLPWADQDCVQFGYQHECSVSDTWN
jgi:hypothetical protein